MNSAPASAARPPLRPPSGGSTTAPSAPGIVPDAPVPVHGLTPAELGRAGEEIVARRLTAQGWTVVERNLRLGAGELDIVALDAGTLVFIEVKTRRSFVTGVPQAAVTAHKLRRLRRLVGQYLMERATPHRDVRIDVVAVLAHPDGSVVLEHLRAVG
ncbi:YraN family protein [Brachybacterium sp. DNPG3]